MNVDTFFEHFDSLVELPDGVAKMRELILQLAVQGKLVEQDERDEPAARVLRAIMAEKLSTGESGNECERVSVPENAKPFRLPATWEWTTVDCIASKVQYGFTASADAEATGVRLLRITDIQGNRVDWDAVPGCDIDEDALPGYLLNDGDIVVARTGGTIGKSFLVSGVTTRAVFASYLIRIVPSHRVEARFIKRFLESQLYWQQLREKSAGTGQPNVNGTSLKSLLLPLPPLAEQRRIVAKVDQLMALCDELEARQERKREGRERLVESSLAKLLAARDPAEFATCWQSVHEHFDTLTEVRTSVSRLRQVILELVVRGRLSAFVDASEGSSPSSDVGFLYNLPVTWNWQRLHDVITLMDSGWSPNCPDEVTRDEDEWGVLKTTAVQNLHFDATAHKRLPGGLVPRPVAAVKPGDILITRAGPKNRVGIACFVGKVRPRLMISDKIIRFHPKGDVILPQFLAICLNAGVSREYLESAKSGMAASQVNISQEKLRNTPIPVPPISEQARLIKECDRFTELCDRLEANVDLLVSGSERLLATCIESLKSFFSK